MATVDIRVQRGRWADWQHMAQMSTFHIALHPSGLFPRKNAALESERGYLETLCSDWLLGVALLLFLHVLHVGVPGDLVSHHVPVRRKTSLSSQCRLCRKRAPDVPVAHKNNSAQHPIHCFCTRVAAFGVRQTCVSQRDPVTVFLEITVIKTVNVTHLLCLTATLLLQNECLSTKGSHRISPIRH